MTYLNENQCAKLDEILEAFGNGNSLDGDTVLIIEPIERKANGLIDVLKDRGFIKRIDAEETELPAIMFLNSSANVFMDSGGFTAEYKRAQQRQESSFGPQVNIHSTGDSNIINTGSHNTIHATFNISKGNVEALKHELAKNKISPDDIAEIAIIVNEESPVNNSLGPNSKNWIRKMLDKSMDDTWEIGLATAGGLLTELLKKFYGI